MLFLLAFPYNHTLLVYFVSFLANLYQPYLKSNNITYSGERGTYRRIHYTTGYYLSRTTVRSRHTTSGQARVYRVTLLRTDGVHCRESAGTGSVNLKVVPSGCCLGKSLVVLLLLLFLTFSVLVANPRKTTLHGGQSRSWSAERGKENKIKSLAAYLPPLPTPHIARSEKNKKIKITRRIYRR